MMCLVRVVGPCRGNIEYLGKHTTRSSCAFSKQGDENWPFQKTNTQKTYKEQEEQKGLPGQDKNTATVITPAANFEFNQDFFAHPLFCI